jgi:hypothetical protein
VAVIGDTCRAVHGAPRHRPCCASRGGLAGHTSG